MSDNKLEKLSALSFEKFKQLAADDSLSRYEKIGFFNEFREGLESEIFADILSKMTALHQPKAHVLDIGAGCSDLPLMFIENGRLLDQEVVMIDSKEMLNQLPEQPFLKKIPGMFPNDFVSFVEENKGRFDAIVIYSVLHYIAVETSLISFVDAVLQLLKDGGQCLIGDIPNVDKRNRFFASNAGIAFHRERHQDNSIPTIRWNEITPNELDDSVVWSILMRARAAGFEAYVLPQSHKLPMANRREDILIKKH